MKKFFISLIALLGVVGGASAHHHPHPFGGQSPHHRPQYHHCGSHDKRCGQHHRLHGPRHRPPFGQHKHWEKQRDGRPYGRRFHGRPGHLKHCNLKDGHQKYYQGKPHHWRRPHHRPHNARW